MTRVELEANDLGPAIVAFASEGTRLLDVCDSHRAPVEFSCRSASCGTCRILVISGLDRLEPPAADEREVLAIFDSGPQHRLACQAKLKGGEGRVVARWDKG